MAVGVLIVKRGEGLEIWDLAIWDLGLESGPLSRKRERARVRAGGIGYVSYKQIKLPKN